MKLSPYLKAIYGAIAAGLAATLSAFVQGHGHIGYQSGLVIGIAFWGALGVIWGVPNAVAAIQSGTPTK